MKITVKSRQEKAWANLLSTFPKDHRFFQVREEHSQPPFFMYENNNNMQTKLVICSYVTQLDFLWVYKKYEKNAVQNLAR